MNNMTEAREEIMRSLRNEEKIHLNNIVLPTRIRNLTMKRNQSNGRLEEVYTHDLFISVINTRMTAGEIADKIGCNKTVATRKLKDLLYAGKINGEKVAGRWVFWPVSN